MLEVEYFCTCTDYQCVVSSAIFVDCVLSNTTGRLHACLNSADAGRVKYTFSALPCTAH